MPKHLQWPLVAVFAAVLGLALLFWFGKVLRQAKSSISPENALQTLITFETQEAKRYWGPELTAVRFGSVVERLWDELNSSSNKLLSAASMKVGSVILASYTPSLDLPQKI